MADAPAPGTGAHYPDEPEPQTNTSTQNLSTNQIVLTQEQFDTLLNRLNAGNVQDKAPAPSMTPGVGMSVNNVGRAAGVVQKYNSDTAYYPNPIDALLDFCDGDNKMRRHNIRENFFITWDVTAKPYENKYGLFIQEPTFHLTLYANDYDEQGEDTGRAVVIQTLHMNEDEEIATIFAADQGIEIKEADLRELMNRTRYERARRWLVDIFYPPRVYDLTQDFREEAIGGSVVKVVTKSNIKGFGNKTPSISEEELQ